MITEQEHPDLRRLWQSQADESTPMSIDDLRSRVSKMNQFLLFQAFIAGLAFLLFLGFFGATLTWRVSTLVTRADIEITRCIFLIGAGYGLWQLITLLRRAGTRSLTDGEPNACATFYRSELERQRNSSRRSAVWIPLAFSALWLWGLLAAPPLRGVMIVIWILFVPFWIYRNTEVSRASQRELDQLNARSGQSFS